MSTSTTTAVESITAAAERTASAMRTAEERISQCRQAFDRLTAELLKLIGKAEAYKEALEILRGSDGSAGSAAVEAPAEGAAEAEATGEGS